MKTLFIGGIKSGKSRLAEAYILDRCVQSKCVGKPYYIATTEFIDEEMRDRISVHQKRRQDAFVTLEESMELYAVLQRCQQPALVECVSMWLNNMLYHDVMEADILNQLEAVLSLPGELVLVHNEVGLGIIPDNPLARQFVDLSGKAAQIMGRYCEAVFFCSAGLKMAMK